MAKSREIPTPDPVNESESETEESETEESDSESESEQVKAPVTTPAAAKLQKPVTKASEQVKAPVTTPAAVKLQKPVAKAAAPAASSSDEESGSEYETDSESDSPPKKPDTNVKPLPEKKPSSSSAVGVKKAPEKPAKIPPTPATGMKRSAETPAVDTKRSKKTVEKNEAEKKEAATEEGKKLFERVFNPEDEIIVLEELLKRYPISVTKDSHQIDDLYECIKGKTSVPVSKAQVQDKIRRLRIKFFNKKKSAEEKSENTKERKKKKKDNVEENGKDEIETRVYELSYKIWGNEEPPKSAVKGPTKIALKFEEAMGNDEKKKEVSSNGGGPVMKKKVSYASNGGPLNEWIFGEGTGLVAEEVKDELEKEWKEIRMEEARLFVKRLELSLKHAKVVYNSMSS